GWRPAGRGRRGASAATCGSSCLVAAVLAMQHPREAGRADHQSCNPGHPLPPTPATFDEHTVAVDAEHAPSTWSASGMARVARRPAAIRREPALRAFDRSQNVPAASTTPYTSILGALWTPAASVIRFTLALPSKNAWNA